MLKNTFCHIRGVGLKTEQNLWDSGIHDWDMFKELHNRKSYGINRKVKTLNRHIDDSIEHLDNNNPHFFIQDLPVNQHWRLFPDFRKSVAYIDIETTGLSSSGDYITTIALYDGEKIFCYVKGDNLNDFKKDIRNYNVIITYSGKCFDVPFIRSAMKIQMPHVHIDLRYVLNRLGYMGGLKGCEKKMGLERGELEGIDGYGAVLLWKEFRKKGKRKSLETLLAYNIQDVLVLETLMVRAYNLNVGRTPFKRALMLEIPVQPDAPFKPDRRTVKRIRKQLEKSQFYY